MPMWRVNDVRPDFIGHNAQAARDGPFGHALLPLARIHNAERIVRIAEPEHARAHSQAGLHAANEFFGASAVLYSYTNGNGAGALHSVVQQKVHGIGNE